MPRLRELISTVCGGKQYIPENQTGSVAGNTDSCSMFTFWKFTLMKWSFFCMLMLSISSCKTDCKNKSTFYRDEDGDGYGHAAFSLSRCEQPPGYVRDGSDCNDADSGIHPGAVEIDGDGIDQDCDGFDGKVWFLDADLDGYGSNSTKRANTRPSGYVTTGNDCNDSNRNIHPGAPEIPNNGIDEDCDGKDAGIWFQDSDRDGFGNVNKRHIGNLAPAGFISDSTDCNDSNDRIHPGAKEIAGNGIDEDCDGIDALRQYRDKDDDGFGNPDFWMEDDILIPGHVTNAFDCNDENPKINPVADELCDGLDNNCDEQIDEGYLLMTDNKNCGTCGNICPPGYTCQNGNCVKL